MINVVMKVQHDEDSGNVGYWALDNYAKTVIVWANSAPNLYCALETYSGTWTTFSGGSLSPQNGVAQQASGSGRMTGAYVFTFTAPTITPTKPMQGNIGTYDFGGTPADIQLGTYALQTGPTAAHVFSFYFGPFTSENDYQWSWMYTNGKGVGYGNM